MSLKFRKDHKDPDVKDIQRQIEDEVVALDKNGNIVLPKDIHCRSLYVEGDSLYIGGIKIQAQKHSDDGSYLQYNRTAKQFSYENVATQTELNAHMVDISTHGVNEITDNSDAIAFAVALGMP